jgi:predicted lactoylglutathione lyase
MRPRLTFITLGVDDLERAVRFYRDGLGWRTKGIVGTEFENGAVAFFDLSGGLKLALFPRKHLSHDSGLPISPPATTDVAMAHNVTTRGEVDTVMAEAEKAGARVVKRQVETFYGGYAGYFQDTVGHLWEVAWNPEILPED